MISFRQKIFITYVIVFFLFIVLMFPFAESTVKGMVQKAMEDRAEELISKIDKAPNNDALIRKLKEQKPLIFFRVSLISNERKILYDSHTKHLLGLRFSQEFIVTHPEVLQAFKEGIGYHEEYSDILSQEFAYLAKAFNFHGKTYVLRTAFPFVYIDNLTKDFTYRFIASATAVLLLFSAMTWFIINYFTRPIKQIITAIRPYQLGITTSIPEIEYKPNHRNDEFGQLADTLNSLSVKIRRHIQTLELERNEKEAVLESLIEGVVAVDDKMVVTFANAAALKILDLQLQNVLEQPATVLRHEQCYHLLEQCQQQNKVLSDTIEHKKKNGRKIYLDIVAAPKKDEMGAILVLQDRSEHYKIIEMRKDFVANASHELKTPITIIRGFAETLHDNPDFPREMLMEITGKIVRNCQKMTVLIKDLLILTDIEHIPESRLLSCDLLDLIENSIVTIQDAYPDAQIELKKSGDQDFHLIADPNLIELALNNLMENAAKYSDPPAKITVSAGYAGDMMTISVADQGFGIPEAELEGIFHRFYRGKKGLSKRRGGSGLGLSIVETIIGKHFGKITVESEEDEGSTFTVYLPLKRISE
ncbi:MAG: ATP-binding protein [Waddliaceae bacterium]